MEDLLLRRRALMQDANSEAEDSFAKMPFTMVAVTNFRLEINFDSMYGTDYELSRLKYNINDSGWVQPDLYNDPEFDEGGIIYLDLTSGDELQIIGEGSVQEVDFKFPGTSTKYVNLKGNLLSLIAWDDFTSCDSVPDYEFKDFFSGFNLVNSNIVDISDLRITATSVGSHSFSGCFRNQISLTGDISKLLPATTLAPSCYEYMFLGASITIPPKLPATVMDNYCYHEMFSGASLIYAPDLPAMTLAPYCYYNMFADCSYLESAPALPATTLAEGCYSYMFIGCVSLTTAPNLPATTLADYCYQYMFRDCTLLTTAPVLLPATTLASSCYGRMFYNCESLTTAPILPALTLVSNCYNAMFRGCSSLTYIKAMFTTTPGGYTRNWVYGVSSTGTFVKNSAATWDVTGNNGIPTGWTVVTESA